MFSMEREVRAETDFWKMGNTNSKTEYPETWFLVWILHHLVSLVTSLAFSYLTVQLCGWNMISNSLSCNLQRFLRSAPLIWGQEIIPGSGVRFVCSNLGHEYIHLILIGENSGEKSVVIKDLCAKTLINLAATDRRYNKCGPSGLCWYSRIILATALSKEYF